VILCDTNIIVELYKGNSETINALQSLGVRQIAISAVTQAELFYGAINKTELIQIQKQLNLFHILPIDQDISEQFIQLMAQYSLSHKLAIPDALIAATALVHNLHLYTLNTKDFRFVEGLTLYRPE